MNDVAVQTINECACDIICAEPIRSDDGITCRRCNKTVSEEKLHDYDRYFGYSGYDEHPDD